MATWGSTATLPAFTEFLIETYQETAPNNVIRTQMEIGPDKVRRRGTSAPTPFSGTMLMTSSQVSNLLTFFDTTLNYGAESFDAVHPRTTVAATVRFTAPPQISPMGADWQVAMSFEILP